MFPKHIATSDHNYSFKDSSVWLSSDLPWSNHR